MNGNSREASLEASYWPADESEDLWEFTLGEVLAHAAAEAPDRIALVDGVDGLASDRPRWTYAELLTEVQRVARALLRSFTPGDTIAVYAANRPEWVLLQHGIASAGMTLVPINPAYRLSEVDSLVRSASVVGIFHDDRYRDNDLEAVVAKLRETVPGLRRTVLLNAFDRFCTEASDDVDLPDITPDHVVQVQYTSGTTGEPKGVRLSHRGIVNAPRFVAQRMGFPHGGVWINALPMHYIAGPVFSGCAALAHHGTFVLARRFDTTSFLELVESERGNASLLVPTMLYSLLEDPSILRRDLSSISTIAVGAAAVPVSLASQVEEVLGCRLVVSYGQTETSGPLTCTYSDDDAGDRWGTLGRALPHAEVKVADSVDGAITPLSQPGEIWVRGYQTSKGYQGAMETTGFSPDAWMRTGDIGQMDERGYLRILGRARDVIIRGGANVHPREVEDVILQHSEVAQVSVVGVPDEKWGEVVAAVIIAKDPLNPPSTEELVEHCDVRLASYKQPRRWYFVDSYPLTASGKVQKFKLTAWIQDGAISSS